MTWQVERKILLQLKKTRWRSWRSRPSRRSLRSQELLNRKTGLMNLSGAMTCQGNIVDPGVLISDKNTSPSPKRTTRATMRPIKWSRGSIRMAQAGILLSRAINFEETPSSRSKLQDIGTPITRIPVNSKWPHCIFPTKSPLCFVYVYITVNIFSHRLRLLYGTLKKTKEAISVLRFNICIIYSLFLPFLQHFTICLMIALRN